MIFFKSNSMLNLGSRTEMKFKGFTNLILFSMLNI